MPRIKITSPDLPGAIFHGYKALREMADYRLQYENACQAYERTGDPEEFQIALRSLGCEQDEIFLHLMRGPGYRLPEEFH